MKQEEHNKKREEMSDLEGQLIDKIAETGNIELMDLFINWQTIRLELNMNAINMMQDAFDDYVKVPQDNYIHHIQKGKENECTNCKTINIVPDTNQTVAGYCTECGHPLWSEEKEENN